MEYVLIGAGGHAKVVYDMITSSGNEVLGFVDDFKCQSPVKHIPILGDLTRIPHILEQNEHVKFIIAIGDNETRKSICTRLAMYDLSYGVAIHPSAIVAQNVHLGEGTVVMPQAVINFDAVIGKHVIINTSATVDHDCQIGDFAHLSPGVHLAGGVQVGRESHLGIGVTVIPNIKIGTRSVVGAGAAVIRDIGDSVTAVGIPAKPIREEP